MQRVQLSKYTLDRSGLFRDDGSRTRNNCTNTALCLQMCPTPFLYTIDSTSGIVLLSLDGAFCAYLGPLLLLQSLSSRASCGRGEPPSPHPPPRAACTAYTSTTTNIGCYTLNCLPTPLLIIDAHVHACKLWQMHTAEQNAFAFMFAQEKTQENIHVCPHTLQSADRKLTFVHAFSM